MYRSLRFHSGLSLFFDSAFARALQSNHVSNVCLASCHYDIVQYLQPDWVVVRVVCTVNVHTEHVCIVFFHDDIIQYRQPAWVVVRSVRTAFGKCCNWYCYVGLARNLQPGLGHGTIFAYNCCDALLFELALIRLSLMCSCMRHILQECVGHTLPI